MSSPSTECCYNYPRSKALIELLVSYFRFNEKESAIIFRDAIPQRKLREIYHAKTYPRDDDRFYTSVCTCLHNIQINKEISLALKAEALTMFDDLDKAMLDDINKAISGDTRIE